MACIRRYLLPGGLLVLLAAGFGLWYGAVRPGRHDSASLPMHEQAVTMADGRVIRVLAPGSPAGARPARRRAPPPPAGFQATDPRLKEAADSRRPLPDRLAAVGRLAAASLSEDALGEVLAYVVAPVPAEPAAAERERALRNDLLNRLREREDCAARLVPVLVTQAADEDQDPGLRDYALQHLASWAPSLDAEDRAQAVSALQAALREKDGTYAGTALLGLDDLSRRGFLPEPFDAAAEARRIALDEGTDVLSRLTALALDAELHVAGDDLTALARRWSEPASPVPEGARRVARAFLKTRESLN